MAGGPTTRPPRPTGPAPHQGTPPPTVLDRAPRRAQARDVVIRFQRLDQGRLRLSPVQVEQHVVVAASPHDLARAVRSCFAEVEVAAYARWKGIRPDISLIPTGDSFDDPVNRGGKPTSISSAAPAGDGRTGLRNRPSGRDRSRSIADYTPNADGSWLSPAGRTVRDPLMCRQIVGRRIAAGLPVVPDGASFDLSAMADAITGAAHGAGLTPHEWLAAAIERATKPEPPPPEPVAAPAPVVDDLGARRARKHGKRAVADGQLEFDFGIVSTGVAA